MTAGVTSGDAAVGVAPSVVDVDEPGALSSGVAGIVTGAGGAGAGFDCTGAGGGGTGLPIRARTFTYSYITKSRKSGRVIHAKYVPAPASMIMTQVNATIGVRRFNLSCVNGGGEKPPGFSRSSRSASIGSSESALGADFFTDVDGTEATGFNEVSGVATRAGATANPAD